jgi:hypothetical protein
MLWDSFVLWWGYWELQIINYCLQFINVLHCVICVTSCHTGTECGKFVGFTPQSFAQWRRWRVKLTNELLVTGARLMVSQLLKKFLIFIECEIWFPCSEHPVPTGILRLPSLRYFRILSQLWGKCQGIHGRNRARSALFLISELCCFMCCLCRLCCSTYYLCVNVYCTTATGCHHTCS